MYPLDAGDPVSLIKQADTAMYAAKEPDATPTAFSPRHEHAGAAAAAARDHMRRGLMDDEFFIVYTADRHAVGARVRRRGAAALGATRRGVIAPASSFVAEESGMIQALGARVLRMHAGR